MRLLQPSQRAFIALLAIEALFTPLSVGTLVTSVQLNPASTTGIFLPLAAVRLAVYWWLLDRLVRPSERLQDRARAGREVSVTALSEADAKLQSAAWTIAIASSLLWAVADSGTVVVHYLLLGAAQLPALVAPATVGFTLAGIVGPLGVIHPIVAWLTADTSEENYVLATKQRVELERAPRSVAIRLAVVGLCLVGLTLGMLMGGAFLSQGDSQYLVAQQEARAVQAELRYELALGAPASTLPTLGSRVDAERVTLVVAQPAGDLLTAGAPAPDWATPDLIASAADGAAVLPDRAYAVAAAPLPNGAIAAAVVKADPRATQLFTKLLTTLVLVVLYGLVCTWLLSRTMVLPLQRAAKLLQRATQQGDLSNIGTAPFAQLDEVGDVMLNLNELFAGMRSMAHAATKVGDGHLDVELEGKGELPSAFRRMLQQLRKLVQQLGTTSAELSAAATEILAASREQEVATTSHSTGMIEISQTMDSLSASADHIAQAVWGVLENAERTSQNTDQMVLRIDELTGQANRIGDILDVIREIADRTDLLALNGSLEASRAGEAGVGFALVASEMRRLAERVTASTQNIKTLVSDIRESGASTVVATEESKKLASNTTEAARGITLVTQQQRSSTSQVSANVRSVAEVVQQAASSTVQTRTAAEALKNQADRLSELVNRFELGSQHGAPTV